ncbi:hypothetical protein M8J77_022552 [Diaphorina citri]|nr:hypothetical protein M8J77_022552 [Diaphorina citri]
MNFKNCRRDSYLMSSELILARYINTPTRINPEISAKELGEGLWSGAPELSSVKCSKLKTKYDSYTSFHSIVREAEKVLISSEEVWPEGALVKLFSGKLLKSPVTDYFNSDSPDKNQMACSSRGNVRPVAAKGSQSKAVRGKSATATVPVASSSVAVSGASSVGAKAKPNTIVLEWKKSFVIPIFKSGDRCNISNYRGVCIQSFVPKLLDKLIAEKLAFAFRSFISDEQHGFVSRRSIATNLLCYQHDILQSFKSANAVHSIYADVAKDCALLQADLERFCEWLSTNGLQLSVHKCAVMEFCRSRSPPVFNYRIDSETLPLVNQI